LLIIHAVASRIRRVDRASGTISAVAGTGDLGFDGDGGPATSAAFLFAQDIRADGAGNIIVADSYSNRVRRISALNGQIDTIAGSFDPTFGGDSGPATVANLNLPRSIAFDAVGDLYISDGFNHRVRKVNMATGVIATIAGIGSFGYSGDGDQARKARLFFPEGIALDQSGNNLYIADSSNHC